jgi:hypothetical protein
MSYAVFDLDETLAHLDSIYYFLLALQPEKTLDKKSLEKHASNFKETDVIREKIYEKIVEKITEREASDEPLGLIRPGILEVMDKLNDLKEKHIIKGVVIYSNNGHLSNLEFVRDVIHAYVGNPYLICDCIHWGREGREEEYYTHIRPTPGHAKKTFSVLKKLLESGPCGASNIKSDQIYFFDDQPHVLDENLPKGHSIKVSEYEYDVPIDSIAKIYKECMEELGLYGNSEIENKLYSIFGHKCDKHKSKNSACTYEFFQDIKANSEKKKVKSLSTKYDESIKEILNLLDSLSHKSYGGGKTRRRRKHQKKSRRNNRS